MAAATGGGATRFTRWPTARSPASRISRIIRAVDYNRLHGGIERWFEPVKPEIGAGASLTTILGFCRTLFGELAPEVRAWHVELHQFRIEARPGEAGQPTPEGMHRDGVDYVLVLLVRRRNITSGTTTIHGLDRTPLGSFTLTDPFDAALVHDARVYHGVTPVEPLDPAAPGLSRRAGGHLPPQMIVALI